MPRVDLDSLEKQGRTTNSLQDALEVHGKMPALIRELRAAREVVEAAKNGHTGLGCDSQSSWLEDSLKKYEDSIK